MYTRSTTAHAPACDIAEIAKSERGRDETFQMSQLCVCLVLSVPCVSRIPFEKPRILAKLSAEANSSDYLAFPVYNFSLATPENFRQVTSLSRVAGASRAQKISISQGEIIIFVSCLSCELYSQDKQDINITFNL